MITRLTALVACLFIGGPAFATHGDYLDTFPGNDNEKAVAAALGIGVEFVNFLAKVDWDACDAMDPSCTLDGLTISNLTLDTDDEPTSGDWSFSGLVDLIVIKAGSEFAIYVYDPAASAGTWDTSGVADRGLSHISAYQLKPIPIPAAAWLMVSALFGLGLFRRRS